MATFFMLKVQPAQESRIRDELLKVFERAGIHARIALPTIYFGKVKGHKPRRRKTRPGFLFVDFGGGWPPGAVDLLEGVRGIGAIHSRGLEPFPVSADFALALENTPWNLANAIKGKAS